MKESDAIERTPDRLGGTPVFPGTRVPIGHMLDYIEHGESVHEFGMDYGVPKAKITAVLRLIRETFAEKEREGEPV